MEIIKFRVFIIGFENQFFLFSKSFSSAMGTTDLVTIGFQPMGNKVRMIQSAVGTRETHQPYPED